MKLATKTLAAIEAAFQKDQGAKYRGLLKDLMPLAGDAYSTDETPFRNHLGASLIGRECARELWYSFHWCVKPKFDGRMLRLFNSGHLMEPKIVASLEMIGCKVYQFDEHGKQFRITGHRGHFGGSLDAVAIGIPDLPEGTPALCEFKSHGEKSFIKLKADGLVTAKFEHFVQMQIYMNHYKLDHGLYVAQNKNTDEIYAEIVQRDETSAARYLNRSAMIIDSIEPPPRISTSPGFFKCKFCSYPDICHLKGLPERNCRTCVNSLVGDSGSWVCKVAQFCVECGEIQINTPSGAVCKNGHGGADSNFGALTPELQRAGCEYYEMNPAIKAK